MTEEGPWVLTALDGGRDRIAAVSGLSLAGLAVGCGPKVKGNCADTGDLGGCLLPLPSCVRWPVLSAQVDLDRLIEPSQRDLRQPRRDLGLRF